MKYDKIFKISRNFSFEESGYEVDGFFYSAKSLVEQADKEGAEIFKIDFRKTCHEKVSFSYEHFLFCNTCDWN